MAEIHVGSGRLECYVLLMSATNTFVIVDKVITKGVSICTSLFKETVEEQIISRIIVVSNSMCSILTPKYMEKCSQNLIFFKMPSIQKNDINSNNSIKSVYG